MDEYRYKSPQIDLQQPKRSLFTSALWAIAAGGVVFAQDVIMDRDMWDRPRFWIMSALGAVIVASIFFGFSWVRWLKSNS